MDDFKELYPFSALYGAQRICREKADEKNEDEA